MGKRKHERLPQEMCGRYWLRSRPNPQTPQTSSNLHESKSSNPGTVVGCNVLLLERIFSHLEAPDLINCRLVNTQWNPIATSRLIQLNPPCHRFQYHYIRKCYVAKKDQQLSELIKCAKNSVIFPCTSFTFRAGDMRSEDATEFLKLMGSFVKQLTLNAVDNWTLTGNMNVTTILSRTPNLETLIFDGGSYYDSKPTNRLMLPSLKCIKFICQFYDSMTNIKSILNGAPNLENIIGAWRLDDLEPIVTMNKIHTVKHWCPSKFSFPAGLIQLASANKDVLTLKELVVFMDQDNDDPRSSDEVSEERLWKCFHKILNKNTIQKLILSVGKYPANATFPLNMDNVKELVLMPAVQKNSTSRHFPVDINLNATFPQLKTLSLYDPLYHVCCAGTEWANCFPLSDEFENFDEILPLVTTLNLRGKSTSIQMLRKIKKICPNVQNLEICLNEKCNQKMIVMELCGEWRHLKALSIDLSGVVLKHNLDTAFTGLSANCLNRLNRDRSSTEAKKLKKAEDTRNALWIGNISGLTKLDIKYEIPYSQKSKDQILIPFTRISAVYAFNLMPKLAVNLHYLKCIEHDELKSALRSISPFATIIRH